MELAGTSNKEKGCRSNSAPFFISIVLLYQFQPTYPANFPDFIFLSNSSTYRENRQNGGLTRFSRNRGCLCALPEFPPGIPLAGRGRDWSATTVPSLRD